MQNVVQIGDMELGIGIPKVAVPFMGADDEKIIEEIQYLKTVKLDFVEWRIDYYENVDNVERVKNILSQIKNILNKIPVLVTFRTAREGGKRGISLEYYKTLVEKIASTGNADMVDVELFAGNSEFVKGIVEEVHKYGVKVIMSNHDFHKTPDEDELVARMCRMQELGADIPKIAVMPLNSEDVVKLLSATNTMKCQHGQTPIITMSMGALGVISRLSGETFGSAVTFGSAKAASAPGQLETNELYEILRVVSTKIKHT